jgi:hypothetical protein
MKGRAIRLSRPRRLVIDLLHFARALPTVPVQRQMALQAVVAARNLSLKRPPWPAIFAKAYALAGQEFPVLRRAYVKFPWPHLSESPASSANIIFERDYSGEFALFFCRVENPAAMPLGELSAVVELCATAPIDSIVEFRRGLRLAALPRPLRRLMLWLALNIAGRREKHFGTFGLSAFSGLNADSLHPLSPLTTLLNYIFVTEEGLADVRITYDHRVMDGATVARALKRLEEILNGPIIDELRAIG